MTEDQWLSLIAALMVLVLIGPAVLSRQRGSNWMKSIAIWLAVLVALVWVYNQFGPF